MCIRDRVLSVILPNSEIMSVWPKIYADAENPIIAIAHITITNVLSTNSSFYGSFYFFTVEWFKNCSFIQIILAKRKTGKHARFADQKAARRKAKTNKK